MKTQGYVLVELIVASLLLSLAGTGLYQGVMGGLRAKQVVREIEQVYDPLRTFWRRAEKDMRNSFPLRDFPFLGEAEEIAFPILEHQEKDGAEFFEIYQIRYFIKNSVMHREKQKLSNAFVKENAVKRIVLRGFENIQFQYAYLDEEEELIFHSLWQKEPYYGIPKAVRMEIQMQGKTHIKLIPIPQGRWGRLEHE